MTPADFFDLVAKYGVGVVFAAGFILERTDHAKTQAKLDAERDKHDLTREKLQNLSERTIVAMTEIKVWLSGRRAHS